MHKSASEKHAVKSPPAATTEMTPEQQNPASAERWGGMSANYIMQMQKAVGNKGVTQMLDGPGRSRSSALYGRASNMRLPAPASEQAAPAPIPAPAIPANLQGRGEYHGIYKYLKEKADSSDKASLFGFFDSLDPKQKMAAIDLMAGTKSPTLEQLQKKLITGIFKKSIDWDVFSSCSREAKSMDTTNHSADSTRDYVGYATTGTSATASAVSGSASASDTLFGASRAAPVAAISAPIGSGVGALASLTQIYSSTQNFDSEQQSATENALAVSDGIGGVADAVKGGADTANTSRHLAGMAASGAATAVAGAGAVAGGAAYMIQGIAGYRSARGNLKNLEATRGNIHSRGQSEQTEKLMTTADVASSTQEIRKSSSAATAAKGALMTAGGIALLAAAASPAGPALLAAAALLGGIAAVAKYFKKKKRKEQIVDKIMQVDTEATKPEYAGMSKDKVRQMVLESHGFNSLSQCYTQITNDLAGALFESGVKGEDEDSQSIITSIGLKIDKAKRTPTVDQIARKLSG